MKAQLLASAAKLTLPPQSTHGMAAQLTYEEFGWYRRGDRCYPVARGEVLYSSGVPYTERLQITDYGSHVGFSANGAEVCRTKR